MGFICRLFGEVKLFAALFSRLINFVISVSTIFLFALPLGFIRNGRRATGESTLLASNSKKTRRRNQQLKCACNERERGASGNSIVARQPQKPPDDIDVAHSPSSLFLLPAHRDDRIEVA